MSDLDPELPPFYFWNKNHDRELKSSVIAEVYLLCVAFSILILVVSSIPLCLFSSEELVSKDVIRGLIAFGILTLLGSLLALRTYTSHAWWKELGCLGMFVLYFLSWFMILKPILIIVSHHL